MKKYLITLLMIALAIGCRQNASVQPTIDEATGHKLAYQLTFVFENAEGRPIGCATLLAVGVGCFDVAAPLELVGQTGCRLVEWRGDFDGQKFERITFDKMEVLSSEPSFKLAILRVSGETTKQVVKFANTESRAFRKSYSGFGSRPSQPRPVDAMSLKVTFLVAAKASPDLPPANFFQVEDTLDFATLGSPLVTQQGELAAVAAGKFWNSTLYCPADNIKKLLAKDRDKTTKTISDLSLVP